MADWTMMVDNRARPLVRVYASGRVLVSRNLAWGGEPLHEGQLDDYELEQFKNFLGRVSHGLEGTKRFHIAPNHHRIVITLPDRPEAILQTSLKLSELGRMRGHPAFISRLDTFGQITPGSRFELLKTELTTEELAIRLVLSEIEVELLRAAGQSLLPEPPLRPGQTRAVPHAGPDVGPPG